MSRAWRPAVLALVLLGAWEAYARLGGVDDFLLPAPSEIARALADDRSLLWDNFTTTAGEVLLGILVALAAGLACAAALHFSRTLRITAYPLLVASQTIPVVIIAPLLVVWLGYDLAPKLAIIALICFFPVTVTTLGGLGAVDPSTASSCARSTPRGCRPFGGWRAPRRSPPCSAGPRSRWRWR